MNDLKKSQTESGHQVKTSHRGKSFNFFGITAAVSCLVLGIASAYALQGIDILSYFDYKSCSLSSSPATEEPLCPLFDKIRPLDMETTNRILFDETFRNASALKMSHAVQVDTVVLDDQEDYSKIGKFHEFLENEFPSVWKAADVSIINGYGLVLEFPGTNPSLKPQLFLSHQDTVPAGDISKWNMDPWSGYYDGSKIYGRGAYDCKSLLIGLMESMELLVDQGSKLERTVIFSFGYDEETGGSNGAAHNSQFLLEKYGENSMYHIMDEGNPIFLNLTGKPFGMLGTGEKGYIDVRVDFIAPGGHSSMPPDHTSIGLLSKFLSNYEDDQFSPVLPSMSPMMGNLQCLAEHNYVNKEFQKDVLKAHLDTRANKRVTDYLRKDFKKKYFVQTSQAIDVINGGDKINSLPQNSSGIINHRVAIGDQLETVMEKVDRHATKIAEQYKLGLIANGNVIIEPQRAGYINIQSLDTLKVAPITPAYDDIWFKITGHLRYLYEDLIHPDYFKDENKDFVITPGIMTGNTDTKHYWKLSDHIYRFQPGFDGYEAGVHNANEYISIDGHLQVISFLYNYILDTC